VTLPPETVGSLHVRAAVHIHTLERQREENKATDRNYRNYKLKAERD